MKLDNICQDYLKGTHLTSTLNLNKTLKQNHNMNNLVKIDEHYKLKIENEIKSIISNLPSNGVK